MSYMGLLEQWQTEVSHQGAPEKAAPEISLSQAQRTFQQKVLSFAEYSGVYSLKSSCTISNSDGEVTKCEHLISGTYSKILFEIQVSVNEHLISEQLIVTSVEVQSSELMVLQVLDKTSQRMDVEDFLFKFFILFTSVVDELCARDNLFQTLIDRFAQYLERTIDNNLAILPHGKSPVFVILWRVNISDDLEVSSHADIEIEAKRCGLSKDEDKFIATVPSNFQKMCSLLGVSKAVSTLTRVLCSQNFNKNSA